LKIVTQLQYLAGEGTNAGIEGDTRQTGGFCLTYPVKGSGDPTLGGDEVGTTFEHFQGDADRHLPGKFCEILAGLQLSGWIAANQQLQGPERLLVSQTDLRDIVTVSAEAGLGHSNILLAADTDLVALLGKGEKLPGRLFHIVCDLLL